MKKSISILMLVMLTGTLALSIVSCTEDINLASSEVSSNESSSLETTQVSSEETSSFDESAYDEMLARSHEESRQMLMSYHSDMLWGSGPVEPSMPDKLPVYEEGSLKLLPNEDYWHEPLRNRKYRYIYYKGPCLEWEDVLNSLRNTNEERSDDSYWFDSWIKEHPDADCSAIQDEMYVVTMIKELNITREEMEVMLEKRKDDIYINSDDEINTTEGTELLNLDIIYTLDNDIINEYYRYA